MLRDGRADGRGEPRPGRRLYDEADVEAESGRLDAGRDTTRTRPGFGPILCFGVAPQQRGIGFGATDTNVVSCRLDQATQHVVAGQAEDVANIFRFCTSPSPLVGRNGCHLG